MNSLSNNFDILLVFPKGDSIAHSNMIPYGIASIAAVLEQNDFRVKIVDLNFYKGNFKDDLKTWKLGIIGIGGTTNSRKQSLSG